MPPRRASTRLRPLGAQPGSLPRATRRRPRPLGLTAYTLPPRSNAIRSRLDQSGPLPRRASLRSFRLTGSASHRPPCPVKASRPPDRDHAGSPSFAVNGASSRKPVPSGFISASHLPASKARRRPFGDQAGARYSIEQSPVRAPLPLIWHSRTNLSPRLSGFTVAIAR